MTPSELLTAAAGRVRDLAAAAQRGPWVFDEDSDRVIVGDTVYSVTCYSGADYDDAQWIAALSPAIAPHLESILRAAAKTVDEAIASGWSEAEVITDADDAMKAAFLLARVLVPEVSP